MKMNLTFDKDHMTVSYNYSLREFHDLAMEYYKDSMFTNRDLCAPPTELFKIASQLLHKNYREDIYRLVLYYGTKRYSRLNDAQKEAVWECFLALPDNCVVNHDAREDFVNLHLNLAIKNENTVGIYSGKTWEEFCREFRKENIIVVDSIKDAKILTYWADALARDFLIKLKNGNMYDRIMLETREEFEVISSSIMKTVGLAE